MPISTIVHQNKKILFINYVEDKNDDEMLDSLRASIQYIKQSPEKVMVLSAVEGVFGTLKFMKEAKSLMKSLDEGKIEKSALYGVSEMQKILLSALNKLVKNFKMIPFKKKEEALSYLMKQ